MVRKLVWVVKKYKSPIYYLRIHEKVEQQDTNMVLADVATNPYFCWR